MENKNKGSVENNTHKKQRKKHMHFELHRRLATFKTFYLTLSVVLQSANTLEKREKLLVLGFY